MSEMMSYNENIHIKGNERSLKSLRLQISNNLLVGNTSFDDAK